MTLRMTLSSMPQEPSTSSKYHHEGPPILTILIVMSVVKLRDQYPALYIISRFIMMPPILDTLKIKISTQKFQGVFLRVKKIIHYIKDDIVLDVSNQEPSTSSQ